MHASPRDGGGAADPGGASRRCAPHWRGSKTKVTGKHIGVPPVGQRAERLAVARASMAPWASRSKLKLPERLRNRMSRTEPSLRMRNATSARSRLLGAFQRRQHFVHDVPEILRIGKLDTGDLDVGHVGAGARRLSRQRLRLTLGWRAPFPPASPPPAPAWSAPAPAPPSPWASPPRPWSAWVARVPAPPRPVRAPGGRVTASGAARRVVVGSGAATSSTA